MTLKAGECTQLTVARFTANGAYLADGEGTEVLLPNRYVAEGLKEGDPVEVFIYHDSEDRLVASTDRPLAMAGQIAALKVVGVMEHGAFLDWGLPKDVFVPNRNMLSKMQPGGTYVVYLYADDRSGRVVATAKINPYVGNAEITVKPGQEVSVIVAVPTALGYRVVVDGRHWGMVYSNEVFRPLAVGDTLTGYVRRITEDNRIDISLQQQGMDEVKRSSEILLKVIQQHGGCLKLNDKSSPKEIYAATQMSKKTFKRCVGNLLSRGIVKWDGDTIVLIAEE